LFSRNNSVYADTMKTERRALNSQERAQLIEPSHGIPFGTLFWAAIQLGVFLAGFVWLISYLAGKIIGVDLTYFTNGKQEHLAIALFIAASFFGLVYLVRHQMRSISRMRRSRQQSIASNDLLVELYEVKDCKLVRDPEHGQPMFFVRCDDGSIHCVFEGQDELDEEWYEHPLRLGDTDKPRVNLKIIRNTKTKEYILEEFSGTALPLDACYIINVAPDKWPVDGRALKCRWEDIDKRYQLEKMDPGG